MPALRFGERAKDKLARYGEWLHKRHLPRLQEASRKEFADTFVKIRRALADASTPRTTKAPGESAFVVWEPSGFTTGHAGDGIKANPFGLFWGDMQYVSRFTITGPQGRPLVLTEEPAETSGRTIYHYAVKDSPALRIERAEQLRGAELTENLIFKNQGRQTARFTIELELPGNDIFQARSAHSSDTGEAGDNTAGDNTDGLEVKPFAAQGKNNVTFLAYNANAHRDDLPENVVITNVRYLPPENAPVKRITKDGKRLLLTISVPPQSVARLPLVVTPENIINGNRQAAVRPFDAMGWDAAMPRLSFQTGRSMKHLAQVFDTAAADLKRLVIPVRCGDDVYYPPAAGIPNFVALFGRDSLITSLQTLAFQPQLARETLYALSHYQGKIENAFTEEEPGKILHELRTGELTRLGVTPHSPYYGTIDATPLYAMVFDQYARRTDDTALVDTLWPNFEAALSWIDSHVIDDPESPLYGFLAQREKEHSKVGLKGLKNIGWKDSGHAATHIEGEGGRLKDARYPLALAEVQGYVYGAWTGAARLYWQKAARSGKPDERRRLSVKALEYNDKAIRLKHRFIEKFWLPEKRFIAMALQGNGEPLSSVTTNGAQALLSGIIEPFRAKAMTQKLLDDTMRSGWGLRTLASDEPAYNPGSYHNGSIWPHDNSLVVMGLAKYGLKDAARQVSGELFEAARRFDENRLPEVYGGFERKKFDRTILPYPDTCVPQAWAAGTPYALLASLLGLQIDAVKKEVTLYKPVLPEGVNRLTLSNLNVAGEVVDLTVSKENNGRVRVETEGGDNIRLMVKQ